MENQFKKQMEKSNTDHAKQFQKVYNSSIINVFKHEINAYLQNKKQKNIKNELEKLRLGKLVNNNISERDLVNIKELIAYPLKTLQQIAKLRNINSNMSKGDIIYALIRSGPIIHEKMYLTVSNNDMQKNMISNYRDDNYANIDDIEYIFGDIDNNYYAPILTSSLFNNGY